MSNYSRIEISADSSLPQNSEYFEKSNHKVWPHPITKLNNATTQTKTSSFCKEDVGRKRQGLNFSWTFICIQSSNWREPVKILKLGEREQVQLQESSDFPLDFLNSYS